MEDIEKLTTWINKQVKSCDALIQNDSTPHKEQMAGELQAYWNVLTFISVNELGSKNG